MNSYPRETVEYVRLGAVTVDGVPTVSYTVSVVEEHERPVTWVAPTELADTTMGVQIAALARGEYRVFVKVGTIVIEAGRFEIT